MARWTRDQLLLALNLYHQTPFGKQHKTHPPIIALAEKLDRTPSSVAMKLNNFTSLDPIEKDRGVKGLSGASRADRAIWDEFYERFEPLADASEPLLHPELKVPTGPTEIKALVQKRRHQSFFRKAVLGSYGNRCCMSGLPISRLLRASHIMPWKESTEHRLNPRNGLCLAGTYDLAFDQFLISVDAVMKVVIGATIRAEYSDTGIHEAFARLEGASMRLPEKNIPDPMLVSWHRKQLQ